MVLMDFTSFSNLNDDDKLQLENCNVSTMLLPGDVYKLCHCDGKKPYSQTF